MKNKRRATFVACSLLGLLSLNCGSDEQTPTSASAGSSGNVGGEGGSGNAGGKAGAGGTAGTGNGGGSAANGGGAGAGGTAGAGGGGDVGGIPVLIAPPLDPTVPGTFIESIDFIYSGPNAVQYGAAPFDEKRIAVIRGQVHDRDGMVVPDVRISITGHPEYGYTRTRADGWYDIVVNGGDRLVVHYDHSNYLLVDRKVKTPWQDWVIADDVVLTQLDPNVTAVNFGANDYQVAQGSVVMDQDGQRQVTMLFQPMTNASLEMPDGTTQNATMLHIRATEFTVGDKGPQAMPADLPPTTGYTFAAELSADEAMAQGAKSVQFDKTVYVYLDNFIPVAVGEIVPSGNYQYDTGEWVASENGAVIKILDVAGGLATIDATGDGLADTPVELTTLGFTDGERTQLASLYAAGKELWRVPIAHMSVYDFNFAVTVPNDAIDPPTNTQKDPQTECIGTQQPGASVIGCRGQTISEQVPIAGTPYSLTYSSNRALGYNDEVVIPVTTASPPASLLRAEVTIYIAGQKFVQQFPKDPNQSYTFVWNGRDTYGRPVGSALASVEIRYFYKPIYAYVGAFAYAFAKFGLGVTPLFLNGNPIEARNEFSIVSAFAVPMGIPSSPAGLGGWNVDVHHVYDPISKELVRGDGSRKSATELGSRTARRLAWPMWLNLLQTYYAAKAAPDGSIWVLGAGPILMHVDTSGVQTSFNVPAECTQPYSLAVANNEKIYIGCNNPINGPGVWRINPGQDARLIAGGNGIMGSYYDPMEAGEGVPAVNAKLSLPYSLAVGPDGSLYVAGNAHIRRIDTNGLITTVADDQDVFGDHVYAYKPTEVHGYTKLAVGRDGSLYYTNTYHVTQVRPDGSRRIIAGAPPGTSGEEPPPGLPLPGQGLSVNATLIGLRVENVAVSSIGLVYLQGRTVNTNRGYVMEVRPDGTASMYAGPSTNLLSVPAQSDWQHPGPPIPAYDINFTAYIDSFSFLPNDSLFWLQSALPTASIPYLLGPAFEPGTTTSALDIAIADRGAIEIFDRRGRHLRTEHPLTGATLRSFGYDPEGHLRQITDAAGQQTIVNHSVAGDQVTITAPHGQTTQLTIGPEGWLKSVTNPLGEEHTMTYDPPDSGLIASFTNPRNFTGLMTYNGQGRLETDTDATNAVQTLARVIIDGGDLVRHTSGEGRVTEYTSTRSSNDDALTIDRGLGHVEKTTRYQDNSARSTSADGVTTTQTLQADPRFGLSEPILRQRVTTTPAGLARTESFTRAVTLTDPADIKSLATQVDTITVNGRSTVSTYDATDHSISIVTPEGRTSKQTIDDMGRVLGIEIPGILPIAFQYDAQGRLEKTTQGTRVNTLTYDAQGYLSSMTNPLTEKTLMSNDAAGRLTSTTLPDMKNMTFTYDTMGNMTSLTPPEKLAHGFSWTPLDRTDTYKPPMVSPGGNTTYGYDKDRLMTGETLPTGANILRVFDDAKRLESMTMGADSILVGYFSGTTNVESISHSGGVALNYTYDGSLPLTETYSGNVSGTVTKTYDQDFRVASRKVNGLVPISYDYDNDGLLVQAGDLAVIYEPNNGLLKGTTAGTITTSYEYSPFGEASIYTAKAMGADVFKCDYTRDDLGRIKQKIETIGGVTSTYDYQYDNRGRLMEVKRNGSVTHTYTYDGNGNRLSETTSGTVTGTYDAQDRLLSYDNATYGHNAHGQRTQKTVGAAITGYSYDPIGNLRQVNLPDGRVLTYEVDGRNRRVGKRINGALVQAFLYDGQLRPIAELDGTGAVVSQFVYAIGVNVPDLILKGGSTYRVITDHLGSPRLIVDTATNAIVQRMDYDAFGKVEQDTNPGFQPFGFAGGLYDRDTSLVRFGARDYDAETGRWTAKDRILFRGGDANLYAYVGSNPIMYIDPTGSTWEVPLWLQDPLNVGTLLGTLGAAIEVGKWVVIGGSLPIASTSIVAGAVAGLTLYLLDRLDDPCPPIRIPAIPDPMGIKAIPDPIGKTPVPDSSDTPPLLEPIDSQPVRDPFDPTPVP